MKKSSIAMVTIDVKRYGGQQVVIYRNRVAASGATASEALRKAQLKYPRASVNELRIFAVPETVRTVYVSR